MHTVLLSNQFISYLSISALSLTPLKRFQRGHWPCWNVYDPAEISNLRYKEKLGNSRLHFRFQWGHWPRWNHYWLLLKRLSRRIQSHLRNDFSLLIRGLYLVDWWKKPRVENLVTLSLSIRIFFHFKLEKFVTPQNLCKLVKNFTFLKLLCMNSGGHRYTTS
jgi:hypothetical protein